MSKNKGVVIAAVAVLIIITSSFAFIMIREKGIPAVKITHATIGNIESTVTAIGEVSSRSVLLGAKTSGRISWIGIGEGDTVKSGEVLVKLEGYNKALSDYNRTKKLYSSGFASRSSLEENELALEMYCIKSPIAGSVSRVDAKAGESVLPGNDIISVVDQKETWVELQIDEIDIAEVSVGQQVRIYTDAYADQVFLGKVAWKSPEAELKKVAGNIKMDEEDLVFRAKVVLLSGKKILKPGMSVTGEIVTHKKAGVLVIPREAIFVSDNKSYVFVAVKGKARKKEITLGSRDPDNVEVIRGISSGETIAISNLAKLKDKGAVKIER